MASQQQIVDLAIELTPVVIGIAKTLFRQRNPDLPEPTSEEVIASFESAFVSSRAKDEAWLAQHPE